MKSLLNAHALLLCVLASIAIVWGIGRALLGQREGHVDVGSLGGDAALVRSAPDGGAERAGERIAPRIDGARDGRGIWLHGRVADGTEGFAGALSFRAASEEESHVTRTQPDGFYQILLERGGPYAITFEPAGLGPKGPGLPSSVALSARVGEGGEATLDLGLPKGHLQGSVSTTAGEPVAGARVALYAGPEPEGAPEGEPLATALSGEDGGFAFRLLEPGDYHVFARSAKGTRFARRSLRLEAGAEHPRIELRWPE